LSKEPKTARNSREKTSFRSFRDFDGLVEMDNLPCSSQKLQESLGIALRKPRFGLFENLWGNACGLSICGAPVVVFDRLFFTFSVNQFYEHFLRYRFAFFL
jgi:hypothetical protein